MILVMFINAHVLLFINHIFINVCYEVINFLIYIVQGGSNMTGTNCDLFTHK
jgi:hypothetical protein